MMSAPWEVREVEAERVLDLRALVLRPGHDARACRMDHDDAPTTFHLAAIRTSDESVLAIMTMMDDPTPSLVGRADDAIKQGWRIRGMASAPEARGLGCAKALVVHGVDRVMRARPAPVWCNARRVAYGFYEKLGFVGFGDEFDIQDIGPHTVMVRELNST